MDAATRSSGSTAGTVAPALARELGGPPWLAGARERALERFAETGLPTTAAEEWRYSRIDTLDLSGFVPFLPAGGPPAGTPAGLTPVLAPFGPDVPLVVTCNGRLLETRGTPDGVRVRTLSAVTDGTDEALGPEELDAFGWLNRGLSPDPVSVDVPDGVQPDQPLVVAHWVDASDALVCPRLHVTVGRGASLDLIEVFASAPVRSVSIPVTAVSVDEGGSLRMSHVQDLAETCWQIANQRVEVAAGAGVHLAAAALGGHYARLRTDVHLGGPAAAATLVAAYFSHGDQMHDFRTFQIHAAPRTTSELLFKGAVTGRAHSVYSGLIRIMEDAAGSDAHQTNRNLKLSPHAWIESIPNLEISNHDVRCTHASAVGPIDPEERFYLESRGLPTGVAERLIVTGFFTEVLDRFPDPAVAATVRDRVGERLGEEGDR